MLCNVCVGQTLVSPRLCRGFSSHVQTVSYFNLVMKLVCTFGYDEDYFLLVCKDSTTRMLVGFVSAGVSTDLIYSLLRILIKYAWGLPSRDHGNRGRGMGSPAACTTQLPPRGRSVSRRLTARRRRVRRGRPICCATTMAAGSIGPGV